MDLKGDEVQSLRSAYVFGDSILVGNWTTLAVAGTRTIPPSRNRIILHRMAFSIPQ